MEDLDALAGDVAFRFAESSLRRQGSGGAGLLDEWRRNTAIVTAAVDSLQFGDKLTIDRDIVLEGFVSWVGKSSMEVTIELLTLPPGSDPSASPQPLGRAYFLMVARQAAVFRASPLPWLRLEGDDERARFEAAQQRRSARLALIGHDLHRSEPTAAESALIHALFLRSKELLSPHTAFGFHSIARQGLLPLVAAPATPSASASAKPPSSSAATALSASVSSGLPLPAALAALSQPGARLVATGDTRYSATMVMQSQNRNLHGKIFGGFLMRQAMEIAWCNAHLFAGAFPHLELVDDIIFHKPVEIGSIVHFRSLAAFSHPPSQTVVIAVAVEMQDPVTRSLSTTNTFFFEFRFRGEGGAPVAVPVLIPNTYEEAMLFLRARRVFMRHGGRDPDLLPSATAAAPLRTL